MVQRPPRMATIAARRPRLKSLRVCGYGTASAPYRAARARASERRPDGCPLDHRRLTAAQDRRGGRAAQLGSFSVHALAVTSAVSILLFPACSRTTDSRPTGRLRDQKDRSTVRRGWTTPEKSTSGWRRGRSPDLQPAVRARSAVLEALARASRLGQPSVARGDVRCPEKVGTGVGRRSWAGDG